MYDRGLKPPRSNITWIQRLQQRWREGIRHKVTPLGAMILVLLFTSGVLAFTTTQNVFFLLFSLLLASILISSFVNRLMLAGLEVRLDLPQHAMAGEPAACSLIIENSKSWLSSFALELVAPVGRRFFIPIVETKGQALVPVEVVWGKRGVPEPVVVELSTRFPFGFSIRRTRVAVRVGQALYPSIREEAGFRNVLSQIQQRAAMLSASAEAEFSHLREYRSGDDWRRIAWGKSSRGGSWIVKETTSTAEDFLHLGLEDHAPDFERTVSLAAFIVWELQHSGIPFRFDLYSQSIAVVDRRGAYDVLSLLALIKPSPLGTLVRNSNTFLISSDSIDGPSSAR